MSKFSFALGQKWTSENEPEIGIGQVIKQEFRTVTLLFPVSGEQRIYNSKGEPPLLRYILKKGERATSLKGASLFVDEVEERDGVLFYKNKDKVICEAELSFRRFESGGEEQIFELLRSKNFSTNFDFELREQAQKLLSVWESSAARGMLGARVDLLPHQLYLCARASRSAALPRLMLSDEVGLGKTIESGLIWSALWAEGRIKRTLIIVPEQLKNQWLFEMAKRFNKWFAGLDEDYNDFLSNDNVIVSMEFLLRNSGVRAAVLEVEWDFLIVDEAHRLVKTAKGANAEYELVASLASKTAGLLLLSGTPIQLAPEAYFYRLALIDSARFSDWDEFAKNQDNYRKVARDLEKVVLDVNTELNWEELQKSIPKKSPIYKWMPIKADLSLSPAEWMRRVIDALGTGSAVFRNTRKSVKGFPKRVLHVYEVPAASHKKNEPLQLQAEWLLQFITEHKNEKLLLITSSSETVNFLFELLSEKLGEGAAAVFREEESSLERDKAAATFMNDNYTNILLSSEIGSEGRNFQFAKHLILFDLPEDPALLEQRIGRLDRIGQGAEIHIHIPLIKKSKMEMLFLWYSEALGIFEHSHNGGGEIYAKFDVELKTYLENPAKNFTKFVKEFLPKGKLEMQVINEKAEEGRDRLLEFNSQDAKESSYLLAQARKMDENTELLPFALTMFERLDFEVEKGIYPDSLVVKGQPDPEYAALLGVDNRQHSEDGEMSESDGCSITVITNRKTALNYENIPFFHWEHPIMRRLFDKATAEDFGVAASVENAELPNGSAKMQYNFLLEFSVNANWGVSHLMGKRFLQVVIDSPSSANSIVISEELPSTLSHKTRSSSETTANHLNLHKNTVRPCRLVGSDDLLTSSSEPTIDYFCGAGFEEAKESLNLKVKNIAEEIGKQAISALESELHRLEETYTLIRNYEIGKTLEQKKRDIAACKKSLESPKLRLDSVRMFTNYTH
ncbi:RNA polymerase-associated protein RapA [Fibrobacterales bacterium]|nr:RNA polymerase-associated protein RapA [Fibrobacterales bacterium]